MVKLIILASSKFPSLSIKVLISETNKVSLCLPWAIDKLQTSEKIVKQKRNVIFLILNFGRFFSKWCEILWCQTNKINNSGQKQAKHSIDWLIGTQSPAVQLPRLHFGLTLFLISVNCLKAAHDHSMIHWPQLWFQVLNLIRLKLARISKLYLSSEFS